MKFMIYGGGTVGSIIGGAVGSKWGGGFGSWAVMLGFVGTVAGALIGYRIASAIEE